MVSPARKIKNLLPEGWKIPNHSIYELRKDFNDEKNDFKSSSSSMVVNMMVTGNLYDRQFQNPYN
jgi:hypothetical protein